MVFGLNINKFFHSPSFLVESRLHILPHAGHIQSRVWFNVHAVILSFVSAERRSRYIDKMLKC